MDIPRNDGDFIFCSHVNDRRLELVSDCALLPVVHDSLHIFSGCCSPTFRVKDAGVAVQVHLSKKIHGGSIAHHGLSSALTFDANASQDPRYPLHSEFQESPKEGLIRHTPKEISSRSEVERVEDHRHEETVE